MVKKYFLFFILIIFIAGSLFVFVNISAANAQTGFSKFKEGYEKTGEKAGYDKADLNKELPQIIGKFIRALLTFLGIIFLLLMIYGGYTWMLARGNENEVEKAKNTIKNAIIGLLVVAGAYSITYFVSYSLYDSQYFQYNEENIEIE